MTGAMQDLALPIVAISRADTMAESMPVRCPAGGAGVCNGGRCAAPGFALIVAIRRADTIAKSLPVRCPAGGFCLQRRALCSTWFCVDRGKKSRRYHRKSVAALPAAPQVESLSAMVGTVEGLVGRAEAAAALLQVTARTRCKRCTLTVLRCQQAAGPRMHMALYAFTGSCGFHCHDACLCPPGPRWVSA